MIAPILTFILIQILNESSDIWYYFTTSFPSEKIIGILDPQYACYISIVVSPTLILMYRYHHMNKKEAFGKYCDFYKKNIPLIMSYVIKITDADHGSFCLPFDWEADTASLCPCINPLCIGFNRITHIFYDINEDYPRDVGAGVAIFLGAEGISRAESFKQYLMSNCTYYKLFFENFGKRLEWAKDSLFNLIIWLAVTTVWFLLLTPLFIIITLIKIFECTMQVLLFIIGFFLTELFPLVLALPIGITLFVLENTLFIILCETFCCLICDFDPDTYVIKGIVLKKPEKTETKKQTTIQKIVNGDVSKKIPVAEIDMAPFKITVSSLILQLVTETSPQIIIQWHVNTILGWTHVAKFSMVVSVLMMSNILYKMLILNLCTKENSIRFQNEEKITKTEIWANIIGGNGVTLTKEAVTELEGIKIEYNQKKADEKAKKEAEAKAKKEAEEKARDEAERQKEEEKQRTRVLIQEKNFKIDLKKSQKKDKEKAKKEARQQIKDKAEEERRADYEHRRRLRGDLGNEEQTKARAEEKAKSEAKKKKRREKWEKCLAWLSDPFIIFFFVSLVFFSLCAYYFIHTRNTECHCNLERTDPFPSCFLRCRCYNSDKAKDPYQNPEVNINTFLENNCANITAY
tara:strand:+ start:871 stop:2766 length:1896 start_codon:yes stop_codon:yes gene_type:complete